MVSGKIEKNYDENNVGESAPAAVSNEKTVVEIQWGATPIPPDSKKKTHK